MFGTRKHVRGLRCGKAQTSLLSYRDYQYWTFEHSKLNYFLPRERITKALIRLRICAGWSAPLLSHATNMQRLFFATRPDYDIVLVILAPWFWGYNHFCASVLFWHQNILCRQTNSLPLVKANCENFSLLVLCSIALGISMMQEVKTQHSFVSTVH